MKILGIDPGMAIVGYGMIGVEKDNIELLTSGSIQTDKKLDDSKRLLEIYNDSKESLQYTNLILYLLLLCHYRMHQKRTEHHLTLYLGRYR